MKRMRLFILTQLTAFALSLFSCSNLLTEVNSPKDIQNTNATGSVTGSFTYNGAIPQEFLPSQNSNNGKTAFASAVPSEYIFTVQATASDGNSISGSTTDDKTAYILSGLTLDKEYTITITATKTISGNTVTVFQGSDTVTLTSTSPMIDKNITLNAIQTLDNTTGTVNLKVTVPNQNYHLESSFDRFVCTQDSTDRKIWIITIKETYSGQLKSKSYNTLFNLYSDSSKATLLYSFAETINIFDGLETNTWIKNSASNGDAHLTLQEGQSYIADCIITPELISKFQSTTLYVDSTDSNSTENGTFDNPYKTLQAAVNNIVTYGNSTDEYTIYIKKDITISERILWIKSNDDVRNITIAGYDDVKTITQENNSNNSNTSLFDFSKADCNITLRDLILDGNNTQTTLSNGSAIKNTANLTLENVTIQNFISLRESSTGGTGGAIYNTNSGYLILKNSKIDSCKCESAEMAHGGAIFNTGTLELDDAVIVGCKTQAGAANNESYGGGIYNAGTCKINKAIITGCSAINSSSPSYAKGGAIYNKGTLILGDSVCNSDGSPDVTIGITSEYSTPNEAFAGAGVFSGENGSTASFTMNRDCVIGKFNPTSEPKNDSCGNLSYSDSTSGQAGTGICISQNNSTLKINGGFISYNYAQNESPGAESFSIIGVGLYYKGTDQAEISNLVISYNKAFIRGNVPYAIAGVGLYAEKSVTLNNVKIENNTYQTTTNTTPIKGKGLYAPDNVTVTLKGTTYFGTDNDIYLDVDSFQQYNGKLKVDSILNPQNTFGVPQQYVATITPGAYTTENAFLTGSKVAENKDKFIISNNSAISYYISSNGKFFIPIGTKYPVSSFEVGDIVFNDGSATPYSVIKSRDSEECTDAEKKAAIAVIFRVGDGSDGNKTLGMGIKIDSQDRWCLSDASGYNFEFDTSCIPDNPNDATGNLTFNNSSNKDGSKNLKIIVTQLEQNNSNDTGLILKEDGTIDFEKSDKNKFTQKYYGLYFAYYYGKDEIGDSPHNTKDTAYETGWYLPSLSELNDIYQANKNNEGDIYKASVAAGGNGMGTSNHLSSSQSVIYNTHILYFNFTTGGYTDGDKNPYTHNVRAIRAFD